MTDTLIEYHFDGDTGIGTRQQGCEWLLLLYCVLFEDREVLLGSSEAAGGEASIAIHQFLERSIGAELALGQNWMRRRKLHTCSRNQAGQGPAHCYLQKSSSAGILFGNTGLQKAVGAAGRLRWDVR